VKKIDGTSRDLKDAILNGSRIIITTIQKFGTEHLATISGQGGRNFAVIIDEAHSSQSGKAAQAMSDALTRDATSSEDIEDMVLAFQKARGPQKNISFLAFTATPRNVTLERFGRIRSDGNPPNHLPCALRCARLKKCRVACSRASLSVMTIFRISLSCLNIWTMP